MNSRTIIDNHQIKRLLIILAATFAIAAVLSPSPARAGEWDLLWSKTRSTNYSFAFPTTVQDGDYIYTYGATKYDYFSAEMLLEKRLKSDGALLWGVNAPVMHLHSIDADSTGVYLGSTNPGSLQKRSPVNGSIIWSKSGIGAGYGGVEGIAIDGSGMYISVIDVTTSDSSYVQKRSPVDGSLIWSSGYTGVGYLSRDIGINSSYAFTAGQSVSGYNVFIQKLNKSNGVLVWQRIYDLGGQDDADFISSDESSIIIMCGAGGTLCIKKFDASTGNPVWQTAPSGYYSSKPILSGNYFYNSSYTTSGFSYLSKRNISDGALVSQKIVPYYNWSVDLDSDSLYAVGTGTSFYQWIIEKYGTAVEEASYPPNPSAGSLSASCVNPGTTARVSWGASSGATSYEVTVGTAASTVTGTTTAFSAIPGSSYDWSVKACGAGGCNPSAQSGTNFTCSLSGACGSANSQEYSSPPTTNLCSIGTPSSVTTNPTTYTWTCSGNGVGGATNAPCTAVRILPGPTINLSANPTEVPFNTVTEIRWVLGGSSTSCVASASPANADWTGAKSPSNGNHAQSGVIVPSDTTFTLVCTDSASRSATKSVEVTTTWAPNDGVCEKLKGERFFNSRADCPFKFSEF